MTYQAIAVAWLTSAILVGAEDVNGVNVQAPCPGSECVSRTSGLHFAQKRMVGNRGKSFYEATEEMEGRTLGVTNDAPVAAARVEEQQTRHEGELKPSVKGGNAQIREKPVNTSLEGNYDLTEDELAGEKEACSFGDAEDCKLLEASKKFFKEYEEDVDELEAMRKHIGKVPQELVEFQEGGLSASEEKFIEGLKFHMGPFSVSGEGVSVKPQLIYGVESNHFNLVSGCGDVRDGLKCEATMEVKASCEASGNGIVPFLDSLVCSHEKFFPDHKAAMDIGSEVIKLFAELVGVDGEGNVHVTGKITMAEGVSMMGGVALGLWEDAEGYRMRGGGVAFVVKEFGGEIYLGIHKSGHKAKFKVAALSGTVEGKIDCQYRKLDTNKVDRVANGIPVHTTAAQKFQPIGFGYGRGPGGSKTAECAKMFVSWTDCLLECDRDPNCMGFDAEHEWDPTWQQCCLRLDGYNTKPGWDCGRGDGATSLTEGTQWGINRMVMAKNQFFRIGFGYGRGKDGVRTSGYTKSYLTFGQCQAQCEHDPVCTGFSAERNYDPSWQQCIIHTLDNRNAPGGWQIYNLASVPLAQSTSSASANREVWAKGANT